MKNIVLGIVFLLFAVVQYNDPDPWLWIALYSFVGIVSFFAAAHRYNKFVLLGGMGVCIVWTLILLPEFINWIIMGMPSITESMKAEAPHIEFTREFLGLILCFSTLGWHFLQFQKKRKKT